MKLLSRFIILVVVIFMTAQISFGANSSVTQTLTKTSDLIYTVSLVCVGDDATGAIADTDISAAITAKITGYYIYRIVIENLAADTDVTDNSDVYIKDSGGTDLLSAEGVDQLDDSTRNYIQLSEYEPVLGTLTLDVDNQATASGVYTITLILVK